ncbi:MAG: M20 metallopeptidase family protein [Candidatus Aminicenantales bacterium]
MRKITVVFLLVGLLGPASAVLRAVDTRTAQKIDQEIEKYKPEIIKIRRFIHMNPELSNREYETAKLVAAKLTALGLEVKTGVAKTGVVGLLRGGQPGPTVAIRADMDALPIQETSNVAFKSLNPGVMHACGHDIHTSVALGTAMVLSNLKDKIKGNVKFIFQPAEEGAPTDEEGGASLMVKEGVLENPTVGAIFGFHVWPENFGQVYFSTGDVLASSDLFQITIKGKSAHGARPHEGIDAIVLAAEVITTLQTVISRGLDPVDPAVMTIGKIEGGARFNIIADKVTLDGTVRALSDANRKKIPHLMESTVKGIIQSVGAGYAFDYKQTVPAVFNHPELGETMLPSLVDVMGKDKVLPFSPQMVSEDFSYFGQKIPGFYFFLGVRSPGQAAASLHSSNFNPDERSIPQGINLMCHLLLDALEKQSSAEAPVF